MVSTRSTLDNVGTKHFVKMPVSRPHFKPKANPLWWSLALVIFLKAHHVFLMCNQVENHCAMESSPALD